MRVRILAVAILAVTVLSGMSSQAAFMTAAAEATRIEDFIERAENADIVVLGEVHDNPEHHLNQAEIVAALAPDALVFEMIPQEAEDEVNELREVGAGRSEIAEALDWANSGWPDFDFYADILDAAPEARVFGAGQPIADVRRAMVEGAAGPFGPDAAIYGLDVSLEADEQSVREALQAEAHCGTFAVEMLPGLVEAQRFRDAGLADAALWARTMTGGEKVVVITGNGHADKLRGMPAAIAIADPAVRVLALGQFEEGTAGAEVDLAEVFDAVLTAPAPDRDDPCDALHEISN